jgi:broad specificity phosphatase PhoE
LQVNKNIWHIICLTDTREFAILMSGELTNPLKTDQPSDEKQPCQQGKGPDKGPLMPEREYGKTTLELIHGLVDQGIEKMSILMRHSARHYDLEHMEREPFLALTEKGKELSFNLGKELPAGMLLRPYSSVFGRCVETAYLIDKGYVSQGGQTVHNRIEDLLAPSYVKKPFELSKILRARLPDFVRHWFEGNISAEIIDPPNQAARAIAHMLAEKLEEQPEKQINLAISHDWHLYLVKEQIMGLKHEDVGRVDYLEGVAIYRQDGRTYIMNHQRQPQLLEVT